MFSNILAVVIIVMLIFTNGITDAPNAIATIVGSKVMKFRKAAIISAIFNFIGIVVMSFVNISVADCISSMVDLNSGREGIVILITAMLSVILFALIAMQFGIPTSETHGLVAGLTGSAVAIYGISSVSGKEWLNVGIGLIWSIVGTFIISYILNIILKKLLKNVSDNVVSKFQTLGMCMMSFMHGAQDGQKFIGILIIFICLLRKTPIPENAIPLDYIGIIIFTAVVMAIGCSVGGKKIVDNIGTQMATLNIQDGFISDVTTIITLLIASLTRFTN